MITSCNITGYPYRFIMRRIDNNVPCLLYRFKSTKTNRVYLVRVECYPNYFFGVKFYLKSDESSPKKYNRLTGLNEPRPIINTCILIMLDLSQQYPRSSFGFIGSNINGESHFLTKRFKVYSKIISTYFSEDNFLHYQIDDKSTYAMVRQTEIKNNPHLIDEISNYFSDNYTNFD